MHFALQSIRHLSPMPLRGDEWIPVFHRIEWAWWRVANVRKIMVNHRETMHVHSGGSFDWQWLFQAVGGCEVHPRKDTYTQRCLVFFFSVTWEMKVNSSCIILFVKSNFCNSRWNFKRPHHYHEL